MKLILIRPPICDYYDTEIRHMPIGLGYLKKALHLKIPTLDVKIFDAQHGHGKHTVALPKQFNYLKDHYIAGNKSVISSFGAYFYFGMPILKIISYLKEERPDFIGVSLMFTPYYLEALSLINGIKKELDIPIIVGGHHASADALNLIKNPDIDFVIIGEAERAITELMLELMKEKSLRDFSQVSSLVWKSKENIIVNDIAQNYDLNYLQAPLLSDFKATDYMYKDRPITMLVTSRSCPMKCSFCMVHTTFGKDYKKRAVENIILEMRERYAQGIRVFDFEDDNLTFDREWFLELCQSIIDESFCDITLVAMNGISYINLDQEVLRLMKMAGFLELNLSLVTTNYDIAKKMNRFLSLEKFQEVVFCANDLGFKIVSYLIIGLPGETRGSILNTLVYLTKLPVKIGASIFYLPIGAPMAKELSFGFDDFIFARSSALCDKFGELSINELHSFFVLARLINYCKNIVNDDDLFSIQPFMPDEIKLLIQTHKLYYNLKNQKKEAIFFDSSLLEEFFSLLTPASKSL